MTEDEKRIVASLTESVATLAEQVIHLSKELEAERIARAKAEFGLRHEIGGLHQLMNQNKMEHGVLVDRISATQKSLEDYSNMSTSAFKNIIKIVTSRRRVR